MEQEKRVRDLMIPITDYATVTADTTVTDAVAVLKEALTMPYGHRSLLVVDDDGQLLGLLTLRDILKAVEPKLLDPEALPHSITWIIEAMAPKVYQDATFVQRSRAQGKRPVREYMEPVKLVTIEADAPLIKAVHLMVQEGVGSLPVKDGDSLVGMIRINELFQEIADVVTKDKED